MGTNQGHSSAVAKRWWGACVLICVLGSVALARAEGTPGAAPLPSWNDGPAKAAIVDFVRRTTTEGSPDFVPQEDRIAVFDNDGTLWPENPVPFELAFTVDAAKERLAKDPKLRSKPAYQAVARGDLAELTANGNAHLKTLLLETHAGQSIDEFDQTVSDWIATAKHPRFGRRYVDCTYQPMQEVLSCLRANGFRTYIVSGGSQEFMRPWAEDAYGIPPEQVIGSVFKLEYQLAGDRPTLSILPEISLVNDRANKPVAIRHGIGRTPIACFGNSDGDHEMLQLTTIGRRPSLGVIIHHTDAEREYAYDAKPKSTGKLVEALAAAPERGWIVVDMRKDWKCVLSSDEGQASSK